MSLKAHNKIPYENIKKAYQQSKSVLYISGVGTGKSYVTMELIENDFHGQILYIIPKYAIKEHLLKEAGFSKYGDRVKFVTINTFSDYEKGKKLFEASDLVVIDEAHHIGSDLYGYHLRKLIQEEHTHVLGLTATPIREDKIDIVEFFKARVDGISNFDAIKEGLMPEITYRLCRPEKDLRQIQKEYDGKVKPVLSFTESEDILRGALQKFSRKKWIAFFPNSHILHQNEKLIKKIYPGYDTFILLSSLRNLEEVLEKARNSEKCVILSCNILLEGVHMPDIDGIALFRNVQSVSAFMQMIGRVCSIGKEISPVVLDCSENAVKLMARLLATEEQTEGESGSGTTIGPRIVVKIGIGAHEDYNIDNLLKLVAGCKEIKEKQAMAAIEKYTEKFHGKTNYNSVTEMQKNEDYKIFKACCELYGLTVPFVFQYLKESA